MIYLGIDIGLNGAICFMQEDGITICKMPTITNPKKKSGKLYDIPQLNQILRAWGNRSCFATLETITGFGPGGLTSGISLGKGAGIVEALLVAHQIPYQIVPPQTWQRSLFSGLNKNNTKEASIVVAKRLFPGVNLIPPQGKKPHDGFADALLLSEWGRRSYESTNKKLAG